MKRYISVITPSYNEEKYIENTLLSIKKQILPKNVSLEIIVVDGESTDNTVKIAKKYECKTIVQKSNIAQARNIGVNASKGEILLFLDADTTISPFFMSKMLMHLKDDVGCLVGYVLPIEKDYISKMLIFLGRLQVRLKLNYPIFMGMCVKKNIFNQVHGFDENLNFCEDLDLLRKINRIGKIKFPRVFSFTSMRRQSHNKLEFILPILRIFYYFIFRKSWKNYLIYR